MFMRAKVGYYNVTGLFIRLIIVLLYGECIIMAGNEVFTGVGVEAAGGL